MTRISASVEVDAPIEKVWEVVADPRNLPRWNRRITKVHGVPREGLAEGTEYTTVVSFAGVGAHVDAEVLEVKSPQYSKIRLSGPVLEAIVTTHLTPIDEHRTRVEHGVEYDLRGGILGRLAAMALDISGGPQAVLRKGTLAQKQQAEGD
jgi:uncharacterized protein YndB with AHSA1/START domain